MELKEYIKVLQKYFVFLMSCAAAGSIIALIFASKLPSGFQKDEVFLLVAHTSSVDGQQSYYNQEKARNFTDTAVGILTSPEFIAEIQTPPGVFTVHKIAPQLLRLTATSATSQDAQNLLEKTIIGFNQKLANLPDDSNLELKTISTSQPSYFNSLQSKVAIPAGFALGALFGILIVSLKVYFKL